MTDIEFYEALDVQVCKNAGRTTINIGLLNEVAIEHGKRLRKLKENEENDK